MVITILKEIPESIMFMGLIVHEPGPEIWPIGTTQGDKG